MTAIPIGVAGKHNWYSAPSGCLGKPYPHSRCLHFQQDIPAVEQTAIDFATSYHASIDHRRKYTGEPYIAHLVAVAELLRSVPHTETEAMICAAWLHNVVEDTPATLDDVERVFGGDVTALVEMLADVSKLTDGNRAKRKNMDREHIAKASPQAKTIKLADLIDNMRSIVDARSQIRQGVFG
ncbi:MAG: bifunctional (p)ppGpp synthetase/guanosine-3',5'-bis(diphosphate) 3'-pyrophosphohydrolase [Methylomicrobium sp.]|nr:bifunctional (p)ppGpp synthetase/guanosine-3',5'-bis(diphosphate) 3'-pyrophosphohydrolase [Methylomicrobium sp.]